MRSLSAKLLLTLMLISVLGTAFVAVWVWRMTTQEFQVFVETQYRDHTVDRWLDYYARNQSWEGVDEAVKARPEPELEPGPVPNIQPSWDRTTWRPTLVDLDGVVVAPGPGYEMGQVLGKDEMAKAQPVESNGQVIGYLILRAAPVPDSGPNRFLERFYFALGLGGLSGTLAALIAGALLVRSLTRPLRQLTAATQAVAQGNLGLTIPVGSNDEIGRLASSFNTMSSELAAASEMRKQMTADIAHELRTPLSLILGHAEALSEGLLPPSQDTYTIIYDEALRLARLVEDLRTLALSDTGELQLLRQVVDLRDVASRAIAVHTPQAESRGIELKAALADEAMPADVDPDRVTQVLDNLLTNALRHTPRGGRVTVEARICGENAQLVVRDTGPGLPEEELERVFERFHRVDRSRHREDGGTGLGLAIARSLVEGHGGRMWAENADEGGALFCVEIPLADEDALDVLGGEA